MQPRRRRRLLPTGGAPASVRRRPTARVRVRPLRAREEIRPYREIPDRYREGEPQRLPSSRRGRCPARRARGPQSGGGTSSFSGNETAVAAAIINERRTLFGITRHDFTDEYGVIAGREFGVQTAIDPCERVIEHGGA